MQRSERRFRMLTDGVMGRNLRDCPDPGYEGGGGKTEQKMIESSERRFGMLLERFIGLTRRVEEFVRKI